jgi:hypothetical protein
MFKNLDQSLGVQLMGFAVEKLLRESCFVAQIVKFILKKKKIGKR